MTREEIEKAWGFRFIRKSDSWLMRSVAGFLNLLPKEVRETSKGPVKFGRGDKFMEEFATTYRLPFQSIVCCAYPGHWDVTDPFYEDLWAHEGVHAKDLSTAWGLFKMFWLVWLLPLPIVLSGRWYIERWAFLQDIERKRFTIEEGAEMLWRDYLFAWPRPWVIRWWKAQLAKREYF